MNQVCFNRWSHVGILDKSQWNTSHLEIDKWTWFVTNFIEINCAIAKPRAKKYRLIINRAISSECVLAWVVLRDAQRWCAIRISGIWDDITQAPFHHIIQRWADGSVAVYIAASERLSEIFALSQMPMLCANKSSLSCTVKLESSMPMGQWVKCHIMNRITILRQSIKDVDNIIAPSTRCAFRSSD